MFRPFVLAAAFAVSCLSASAHVGGHGPLLAPEAIRLRATAVATWLTENDPGRDWGRLAASWRELPLDRTEILAVVDGYFVVAVRNDAEDRTLYVLVAANGDVVDANFTGKFPYVYDVQDGEAAPGGD